MKKPLIIFLVALGISVGITLLSAYVTLIRANLFADYTSLNSYLLSDVYYIIFVIIDICIVFSLFYFIGKKTKTIVVKSVTMALFVGVFLGTLFPTFLPSSGQIFGSSDVRSLGFAINFLVGFASSSIFQLFFPALGALFFAQVNKKNLANPISSENKQVAS